MRLLKGFKVALPVLLTLVINGCSLFEKNPVVGQSDGSSLDSLGGPPTSGRLHSDTRLAIAYEAILAVTGWDWQVGRSIDGWAVSDWNYLWSDPNAYNWCKARYGSYSSADGDFYSRPWYYGFQEQNYGRAGQCRYFSNLILYRSGTYQAKLPTYQQVINNYYGSRSYTKLAGQVYVGDLIQTKWRNGHTAVVVGIVSGTPGVNVTSVDIIDANYIGGYNNEIVARHIINTSGSGVGDLDNYIGIDVIRLGAR